jgi:hypothetical protein
MLMLWLDYGGGWDQIMIQASRGLSNMLDAVQHAAKQPRETAMNLA